MKRLSANRVISLLLTLAMLLGTFPAFGMQVSAANATTVVITDSEGNQIPAATYPQGVGYSWNAETATLSLDNFSGQAISANGDLRLDLTGENTITMVNNGTNTVSGINVSLNKLYISGNEGSSLDIQGEDLTASSVYAINGKCLIQSKIDLNINVTSAVNSGTLYGLYGGITFESGASGNVTVCVEGKGTNPTVKGTAYDGVRATNCSNVSVKITATVPTECTNNVIALQNVAINNASIELTAVASNNGGDASKCIAVNSFGDSVLAGGKIDLTGRVLRTSDELKYANTSKYVVSTVPEDDQFIWVPTGTYGFPLPMFAADVDGLPLDKLVLQYKYTDADIDLGWIGESAMAIPSKKVGNSVNIYLLGGLKGATNNRTLENCVTFSVTSGKLPAGLSIVPSSGNITGSFTGTCPAGSVTITVKDNGGTTNTTTDDRTHSFNLNYGEVLEQDKFISVSGDTIEMRLDKEGTGWSYDGSTATLTLNGYNGGVISAQKDLNLHLVGENTITIPQSGGSTVLGLDVSYNTVLCKLNVTSEDGASLKIVGTDVESSTAIYGIRGNCYVNNGTIDVNVTSTSSGALYGLHGNLVFESGDSGDVSINVEGKNASATVQGVRANLVKAENCSDVKVEVTAKVPQDNVNKVVALYGFNVSNASIDLTAIADNNGGDPSKCIATQTFGATLLTGGKLAFTGRVLSDAQTITLAQTSRYVISTTPASNRYIWVEEGSFASPLPMVVADTEGTPINELVLEYTSEPTALEWVGGALAAILGGTVGDQISIELMGGLKGATNNQYTLGYLTFSVTSGQLPSGLTVGAMMGRLSGTVNAPCDAGSVTITVKDNGGTPDYANDDRYLPIVITYGQFVSDNPVTGVTLNQAEYILENGGALTAKATVSPTDADYPYVGVGSSDTLVFTAGANNAPQDGVTDIALHAVNAGKATLTVSTKELGYITTAQVYVKEKTPAVTISYIAEALVGFSAGRSYRISGDGITEKIITTDTGRIEIDPEWFGKTFNITLLNTEEKCNSNAQTLTVAARPAAPAVEKQDTSHAGAADGMITGLTDAMEYMAEGDTVWKKVSGSVVSNLPEGRYYVRTGATSVAFAGETKTVIIYFGTLAFEDSDEYDIPAGNAGESIVGYYVNTAVSGGTPTYTFSKESGPEWITVDANGYVHGVRPNADEAASELVIRVTDSASVNKKITVNVGATSLLQVQNVTVTMSGYDTELQIGNVSATISGTGIDTSAVYGTSYGITDGSKNELNSGTFAAETDYYLWVKIAAKTGYTLSELEKANITLNGVAAAETRETNGVITAYFKLAQLQHIEYNVSVESGTSSPATAREGASVTVTANSAPAGMVFDKWVITEGSFTLADGTNATTTFTMPKGDVALKATYKDKLYTVTVTYGTSDKPSAKEGETVTITAGAAPAHKEFDRWVVTFGNVAISNVTSATATFEIRDTNVEVKATYKDTVYTVTVTNGTASPATGIIGATVYLNADPAPEHMDFDKWVTVSGTATITDPQSITTYLTLTNGNVEVKATYKDHLYQITVNNATSTHASAGLGTVVTVTADAAPDNMEFSHWEATEGILLSDETATTATFIMIGRNVALTARYKYKEYTVTVSGGTTTHETATSDTLVTITATAAPTEKVFDKWVVTSGNATLNNANNESTYFYMPQGDVTVEATYKDKTYPVSVSYGTSTHSTAKAGETVTVTAIDTPAGKTFGGWKVTSGNLVLDDTESKTVSFTMPSGAVSVMAIFNDIECTVAFIKNGGSGSMDDQKMPYNTVYPLPSCTFTAPNGMEFKCWKVNGIEKNAGDEITVTEYTSVTAIWKNKFYTVSFDANGGSGTIASASAEYSKEYTLPACTFTAPEGKTFKCWSIGGTDMDAGDKITIAGDTAVTAIWMDIPVITYTVSFDANTGTGSMASIPGIAGQYTLPECGFTAPEGKAFKCWSIGDTEKNAGDKIEVTEDITVKAIWKDVIYYVSFNVNGGSGSMTGASLNYNSEYTLPECGFTAPTGSTFKCWDVGGVEKAVGDKIIIKSNTTVTAVWDGVPYTITFEANGGSGTMANESATYNQVFTLPACSFTAPEGKVFKCWSVGGVDKAAGDGITVKGNFTVTAVWSTITYTISFDANGGSGVIAGSNALHNAIFTLPECTYTAPSEELSFKCWSVGGTEMAAGDKITVTADVTVTAIWQIKTNYAVSGTVISYGEATANTKLELIRKGETEAAYVITVNGDNDAAAKGNTAAFSFSDVKEGSYTLRVSKTMHASREYEVTISEDTSIDLSILLYGDVTSDGKANAADATQIKRFYNNKNSIFATYSGEDLEYLKKVADITGEGKVNAADATQIKRYYNNKSSKFDTFN